MIRFALIVASTLGFVLTAALGNFMAPLLQELERFRPQEQQEPQTPVQSRVPALGGLCLMVSTLAAVGVGWTAVEKDVKSFSHAHNEFPPRENLHVDQTSELYSAFP